MDCKEFSRTIMNDSKAVDLMAQLWSRWQDEKGFEDIAEYTIPLAKSYPNVTQAHRKPFGFSFRCDDGTLRIEIRRKGNSLTFTNRRVA